LVYYDIKEKLIEKSKISFRIKIDPKSPLSNGWMNQEKSKRGIRVGNGVANARNSCMDDNTKLLNSYR
jgi:hypothetical protein